MMSRQVFIIVLFLHSPVLMGQGGVNLVPNPSFNYVSSCPPTSSGYAVEFEYYYNWLPKHYFILDTNGFPINEIDSGGVEFGSPDPFHSCNGYYFEYSNTVQDLDGGGGGGMTIFYKTNMQYREFSAVALKKPLMVHQNYCISFYISFFSFSPDQADIYHPNKQMLGFGPSAFIWEDNNQIDYRPYLNVAVQNEANFSDTTVWHKIEGSYVADGTENYAFLGWAEPRDNISWLLVVDDPNYDYGGGYTLFDSVSVVECDAMGMNIDNLETPNVITPNGDGLNDNWVLNEGGSLPPNVNIQIYNRWGELVYQNEDYQNEWQGTTQGGKELVEGIYYCLIQLPPNQKKTGFVYVFR